MDTAGLITIKQIVLKIIHRGRLQTSDYALIKSLVVDGCKDMMLFTVKGTRTVRLQMSPVNTITLPEDYLSFVDIGMPLNGRFWPMTQDKRIIPPMTITNGVETLDSDKGEGVTRIEGKTNTDGSHVNYSPRGYSQGGGVNIYYYKIEEGNNRICIDGIGRTEVTLVYKSSGVSTSGETLIPSICEESIIYFVKWQMAEAERNMSWSVSHKQNYIEACNKVKFLQSPSLDVLYDVVYSSFKQSVKR